MNVYLGEKGLRASWQEPFEANIECKFCGANARIMFSVIENVEEESVCTLHENTCAEEDGKFWPHDSVAVAVYACEKCYKVNAEMNQA